MAGLIGLTMRGATGIEVVGVSVINAPGMMEAVSFWLDNDADSCGIRWRTIDDCHFGGYAKTSPELPILLLRIQATIAARASIYRKLFCG